MAEIPVHPGRETQQTPQQQGLGSPVAQSNANPYFAPNQALQANNAQLQAAQAQQAQAQAQKANAEAAILRQAQAQQGLGMPQQPSPQEVQAAQLTDAIVRGQVGPEQLQGMVQAGELDPAVADYAYQNAQKFLAEDQARMEAQMGGGLGQVQ